MGRPNRIKRLLINNGKLWPSTVQIGGTTLQFQTGKHGKRLKITSKRHRPRHKRLTSKGGQG